MANVDIRYLAAVIGNLAGIPIRVYENGVETFFHSLQSFPKDPMLPYVKDVLKIKEHIGYFVTPYFNYYGIVNSDSFTMVIGPSRLTAMSEADIRELAFSCDVATEDTERFVGAMKSLVQMPLESIVQILCTVNHALTGEKLSIEDITIYDLEQTALSREMVSESILTPDTVENKEAVHNTLALEETLMNMVRKGDVAALREWVANAPAVRGGVIANDTVRQMKNTFIVTATLTSRSAIRGGMDIEEALSLSDSYIRKCEILTTAEQIINMQYHMVLDYTERVGIIRHGKAPTKLMRSVSAYVRKNITKKISTDELAQSLFVSRTHLAARFKSETGMTLTDFILTEKIEEAKRLLRYTDKSLLAIVEYLAFSSQSHFAKTFKKYSGTTPGDYRNLRDR